MEEQVQEFELSFIEETLKASEPILPMIQENPKLLEGQEKLQEINEKTSNEIENDKDIQDEVLGDDFELSKTKVKDNLSDICKRKSENITKCQVKADVAVQCLRKKLQTDMERRSNLAEFLNECELQEKYFQAQANLEKKDRTQIENEMQTAEAILSIAGEKIQSQEIDLYKYKTELLKYENDAKEIFNEFMLLMKSGEKIQLNELVIERSRSELELKQNEIVANHEEHLNQKMCLEQSMGHLQEQLVLAEKRNEELLNRQQVRIQEINETKQELSKLKNELISVNLSEIEKVFEKLKDEGKDKIYAKNKEVEILNQRLLSREDYLKELNNKLQILKNKNSDLIERRNLLTNQFGDNRTVYEELVKKHDENRLKHEEDLGILASKKEKLEGNLQKIESNIIATVQSVEQIKKQLDTLEKQLFEKSSAFTSLSAKQRILESELEELTNVYQARKFQQNSLQEETLPLEKKIEQLTAEKVCLEEKLETLRTTAATEISELNKELELTKNSEMSIELNEIQFENDKIKTLEELRTLKENNEAKLNEFRDNLKNLKNAQVSLQAVIKDINAKLESKTERRDALHSQFTQLQEDIDRLEKDLKSAKVHHENNVTGSSKLDSFQKPAGILKNSNIKSPQKKVTFDKTVNWDTLSESSTDAFFDDIFKKSTNQTMKKRKVTATSDDIFDALRRNSPPEREANNIY